MTTTNVATKPFAKAISEFEPVSLCVPPLQFENAIARVSALNCENIRVIEMTNDDSWIRDCGPTFLINDKGERRAVDWEFNAWGGLVDGLYFPWDQDALVARKPFAKADPIGMLFFLLRFAKNFGISPFSAA